MENTPVEYSSEEMTALSYDDNVAYEEQLPTEAERAASLAGRIGTSKVYLLSESSAVSRPGKRKHDDRDDEDQIMEEDMGDSFVYRRNAILINGTPIANLTTARIFAYATHYDTHPLGLEWVDDNTCVLVFETNTDAREAYTRLQKPTSDLPEMDEFLIAKPFPVALWPPEERINQTLGKGQGLKGLLSMRWARADDVKKKGSMMESKFYQRHGISAGKELFDGRELPPSKRRRSTYEDEEMQKARLDEELDQFLAEDDEERRESEFDFKGEESDVPASPPSRMRSDYIAFDGRTLLERTSVLRLHAIVDEAPDLASRLTGPASRRSRGSRRVRGEGSAERKSALNDRSQAFSERLDWGLPADRNREPVRRDGSSRRRDRDIRADGADSRDGGRRRRSERPSRLGERPKKTQQELDDELDAFLLQG